MGMTKRCGSTALMACYASLLSPPRSVSLICAGPMAQQVRQRQWLFPMATKGFRPERFEHEGLALQLARVSKQIPIWKLGWASNISVNYLRMVERGEASLPPKQREE